MKKKLDGYGEQNYFMDKDVAISVVAWYCTCKTIL